MKDYPESRSRRPRSASSGCCPDRSRMSGPISPTSKKRGEWLASGPMELRVGGKVSLRFKHSELSPHQAPPPEKLRKMDEEGHHAEETITEFDPPRRLAFTWGGQGTSEVVFELAPRGRQGAADARPIASCRTKPSAPAPRAAGIATSPSWSKSSKAGLRRPSGTSSGRSTRNTPTVFRAEDRLSRLGDVHAALVVAQDQQVAARIDLLVDAGTIALRLRPLAVARGRTAGHRRRRGRAAWRASARPTHRRGSHATGKAPTPTSAAGHPGCGRSAPRGLWADADIGWAANAVAATARLPTTIAANEMGPAHALPSTDYPAKQTPREGDSVARKSGKCLTPCSIREISGVCVRREEY